MKKKQIAFRLLYISSGILFTLSSCYYGGAPYDPYIVDESRQKENYYYAPAAQNAPLLTKKNDLSLALHGSFGDRQKGIDMHAAFNPGKNIGLLASYSSSKNDGDANDDIVKTNRFEMGAGYFKKLSPGLHFETYGGLGFGKIKNRHYTGLSRLNNNLFFIQPTISLETKNQNVRFAFVSRFSINNFKIQDTSFNNDREPFVTSQMKIIHDQPSHVFWEPGFVLRAGWEDFLFQLGYSVSTDLTNKELYRAKNNLSVGMILRINAGKKN